MSDSIRNIAEMVEDIEIFLTQIYDTGGCIQLQDIDILIKRLEEVKSSIMNINTIPQGSVRNLTDEESEVYDSWVNSEAIKTGVNLLYENPCGLCKHWIEFTDDQYASHNMSNHKCRLGFCNKIPRGTSFRSGDTEYVYDGYSFEDGYYDEDMHCFERRDQ